MNEATVIPEFGLESSPGTTADNETDTNADTCVLGSNFGILAYTSRSAEVCGFDHTSNEANSSVPIVSGGTAYDCPETGLTYILVFHESLYFGRRLNHSLLNPNQMRHYGIPVWDNPYDPSRELGIEVDSGLFIPFVARGTKIQFKSRFPTEEELYIGESCGFHLLFPKINVLRVFKT